MTSRLISNSYGKAAIRLVKLDRGATRHDLHDLTVEVQLQGEFGPAHTAGDNAQVLPTDTMKNTVYALARAGHRSIRPRSSASGWLATFSEPAAPRSGPSSPWRSTAGTG